MPTLTPMPQQRSPEEYDLWAKRQSDPAFEMWGLQVDGRSSKDVAVDRLASYCLGQKPPEIVGFGSSIGFTEDYCTRHPKTRICREFHRSR
jgi:hypothetical protein